MTASIRHMTGDDVEAAARLQLATALTAYAEIFSSEAPKPSLGDMEDRWRRVLSRGTGWIAEEERNAVGVAGLVADEDGARMESVYVDASRWGHGVGSLLVDTVESFAVERGWLPLRLWVLEKNHRTRHWYEKRGWNREPGQRRTVWGQIDDIGYALGEEGVARWRK